MSFEIERLHFGIRDTLTRLIHSCVEKGSYLQPPARRGATDGGQQRLPGPQGFPGPVEADMTEQPMLNRIPLRAAWRVMTHRHLQLEDVT